MIARLLSSLLPSAPASNTSPSSSPSPTMSVVHQPSAHPAAEAPIAGSKLTVKPKRPLSAFNLFYRYKRQMVLDAIATGKFDKDAILKLVEAKPGLEHHNPTEDDSTPAMLSALQRKTVREALVNKLLPRDTRDRAHRKDEGSLNGAISFLELGKLMNAGWKDCDEAAKEIFKELAEEGREQYHKRMMEFNALARQGGGAVDLPEGLVPSDKSSKKKKSKKKGSAMQASIAGAEGLLSLGEMRTISSEENDSETGLKARVKELEQQLEAERLRARVRELEGDMMRQRSVEDQLRVQLQMFASPTTNNMGSGRSAATAAAGYANQSAASMQGNGLWALSNASMMKDYERMAAAQNMLQLMPQGNQAIQASSDAAKATAAKKSPAKRKSTGESESPNKRQCRV